MKEHLQVINKDCQGCQRGASAGSHSHPEPEGMRRGKGVLRTKRLGTMQGNAQRSYSHRLSAKQGRSDRINTLTASELPKLPVHLTQTGRQRDTVQAGPSRFWNIEQMGNGSWVGSKANHRVL